MKKSFNYPTPATTAWLIIAVGVFSPVWGQDDGEVDAGPAGERRVLLAEPPAPTSGKWEWEYEGFGGQMAIDTADLQIAGASVKGTHHNGFLGNTDIKHGTVDGDSITFEVTREFGNRSFTTTYKGTIGDGAISGTIESTGFDGEAVKRDWNAYRLPDVDPSGLWVWSIEGRNGQERKSWIKLDHDKGELSGLYLTERIQAPIENAKLRGKNITFQVVRRGFGGGGGARSFATEYSGEVSENGIVGKITSSFRGEAREIDWTASRDVPDVDPVGTWTWESRGFDGESVENLITLKMDGGELSGTFSRGDTTSELGNVAIDGVHLSFDVTMEGPQGSMTLGYAAEVDGDELDGALSGTGGGREWSIPFRAKRELPEPKPEGTWTWTTRRFGRGGDGGEQTHTLALKVGDAGSLNGTYSFGDEGGAEIKNAKVDGNSLTFEVERTRGERTFTQRYSGTIRGDVIKGTSRLVTEEDSGNEGGGWANRWEAKRE